MTVTHLGSLAGALRRAATLALAAGLLLLGLVATARDAAAATKYKVKIDSAPQGATVYVDNKAAGPVGVTPWSGALTRGKHTIILELAGYEVATKTVTIARSRKVQEHFLPMVKKPEPPRIDVRADADRNVYGATVFLDGQPKGQAPVLLTTDAGRHLVELKKDGFEPFATWVEVKDDEKATITPYLKEIAKPKVAEVAVTGDADRNALGATVFLDGQAKGPVPVTLATTPGRHLVEVKKDGFKPYASWVEAKDGERVTVAPFLEEIPKPKLGEIIVEADVPDAEVYLDGNPAGTTPAVLRDVVEGLHVVEVRKAPAVPWKQTVQVLAGQQAKVRAELKATIAGQGGSIRVLSNVSGAKVFLDGTDMGEVPVDIKDVKPGEHVVEVKAAGYQPREERVTVNAGSATVLKLDLNKDGKADAVIKVISPVPGADVYIDGGSVGAAPVEQRVSAGEHTVLVQRDGYKKFETKLKIEAGRTETVVAELQAVGKLRVLSDPPGAVVLVNGVPLDRKTPIEPPVELDVGVTVVRIEMDGRVAEEKTVKIEGGKTEVVSVELPVVGMTAVERQREQRGLSSFGARTLPRGRSTIDLGLGYPYFGEIRVNVGAGQVGGFGFDAGVSTRSFGARSELGLGLRFQLVDADPFHAGVFTDLWWGSKLLDNSKRNGLTGNLGLAASLTALTHVTVSGRAYLNLYSDRHCPALEGTTMFEADADPIPACTAYLQDLADGTVSDPTSLRMEELTGESGTSMFSRDNGLRLMTSIVAEIAVRQRWNVWFMLEGAPFQSERALFVHEFAVPMLKSDYATYGRLGATYKF